MKHTLTRLFSKIIATAVLAGFLLVPVPAMAADPPAAGGTSGTGVNVFQSCNAAAGASGSSGGGNQICGAKDDPDAFSKLVQNVINMILMLLGMAAVIMIIIGGVRYVTSNGDPQQTKSAKDTIMYAVIGLVVAIMAYAIVGFVIARLKDN